MGYSSVYDFKLDYASIIFWSTFEELPDFFFILGELATSLTALAVSGNCSYAVGLSVCIAGSVL